MFHFGWRKTTEILDPGSAKVTFTRLYQHPALIGNTFPKQNLPAINYKPSIQLKPVLNTP